MKGKLIIISAPSGSGKTTIIHHLMGLDLNLSFSVSATSRKPRGNEQHGVDYYFMTADEFRMKIERKEFLEWEEVYDNQFYGTLKSEVEQLRDAGRNVLFDIDVIGGLNLKKQFGDAALALFIQAPSESVLVERLKKRGTDSEEALEKRIRKAAEEMKYADRFDHIIVNDVLERALVESERIIGTFIKATQG